MSDWFYIALAGFALYVWHRAATMAADDPARLQLQQLITDWAPFAYTPLGDPVSIVNLPPGGGLQKNGRTNIQVL